MKGRKEEVILDRSGERFRNYIEHSSDLLLVIDTGGTISYVGPSVRRLLGYEPEEIEGTKGYWLMHPDDVDVVEHTVKETALHIGIPSPPMEIRYRHKNGSWRYFESVGTFLKEASGEMLLVVNARDITEHKEADEALRESEHLFRTYWENASDLFYIVDIQNHRFEHVSPSVEGLLGYTAEEFISLGNQTIIHPGDIARVESTGAQIATSGSTELRYRHKNGSWRYYEAAARFMKSVSGAPKLLVNGRDITERKEAELALARRTEELARSNAELEQFAYIASHDLQEPLRMITSYTGLLDKRYGKRFDDDGKEFMGFIVDAAARMKQLINDLLTYSRVGTKRKPPEPVDSKAILDAALLNLEVAIKESSTTVTSDPLPVIMTDPVQLGQLFQNLISNAIKFHGETPPSVHVSAEQHENEWVFSISDNGIGIEPQYFDRIFMIFQRLHTRQQYSGTGIGLAVCKKIVDNMGGRIWVESEPGKGTTFFFTAHVGKSNIE